jgi:hypothetical protein
LFILFKSITVQNLKIFGFQESSKFGFTRLEQFLDNWKSIVKDRNRPTAQCGLVFVLLPARSHAVLDWPSPPGLFPLRTCLVSSRQRAEALTASAACRPRQLLLRHAPPACRPPRTAHAATATGAAPLAGPCLLSAEAKPHLSSPLHSNRRRLLAHSVLPLTVHLHSKSRALATAPRLHAPPRHCPLQGPL